MDFVSLSLPPASKLSQDNQELAEASYIMNDHETDIYLILLSQKKRLCNFLKGQSFSLALSYS